MRSDLTCRWIAAAHPGASGAVAPDGTDWRLMNDTLVLTFDAPAVRFAIGRREAQDDDRISF